MAKNKILIIDDDQRNIFALKAVLASRGMECVTAPDSKRGIELLKLDRSIALVLLDMMMPDLDGYETLHLIRSDEQLSRLPVIAVTARAMAGDRERSLDAGADGYISKPIDVDQLMLQVNTYLQQ